MSGDIDEPVQVHEWNPRWLAIAERLVENCLNVLRVEEFVRVEHIGSTAVPGLAAKPVVDLLVGVRSSRLAEAGEKLAAAGWEHCGEAGVPGRQYLRRRDCVPANAHVVEHASALWHDNLRLRDHLRQDAGARQRYEAAKRQAAQEAPTLLAYSARKSRVIAELLAEAHAR